MAKIRVKIPLRAKSGQHLASKPSKSLVLFVGSRDLQHKLDQFQTYYNYVRANSSLDMKIPTAMVYDDEPDKNVISIDHYRWKKQCNGFDELPVAA